MNAVRLTRACPPLTRPSRTLAPPRGASRWLASLTAASLPAGSLTGPNVVCLSFDRQVEHRAIVLARELRIEPGRGPYSLLVRSVEGGAEIHHLPTTLQRLHDVELRTINLAEPSNQEHQAPAHWVVVRVATRVDKIGVAVR